MSQDFAHLHVHTDHSVLDGHASIKDLAKEIKRLGQIGFATTDHGNSSNTYNGWKAAKEHGLKFLPGTEAYVAPGDTDMRTWEPVFFGSGARENKEERSNDVSGGGAYTHMTLLAETTEGMHNLFRLNTLSWQYGQFKKNRMDIKSIAEHAKGLIGTTGCPSGELQTRLRLGQWKEAMAYAQKMQDIFGKENYFLELMDHNMTIDLERRVRGDLLKVAKELSIPLLATNDLHYVRREDAKDHEHMLCIQSGSSMRDLPYDQGGKRFAFEGEEYYAKSTEEMVQLFPEADFPGAITNTVAIAERASATFSYNPDLRPSVPLPEGHTEDSFLRQEAFEGLARKRPDKVSDPEYIARLEKELDVFKKKNFSGYMLVVSDFMRWAKAQKWQCGPARGCLSADTNILTPNGFKKISEIQVGDTVFDQNGQQVVVPKVFEYDCDEELVEITSYYGGEPIKMTADHKVLVSKADRELTKTMKTRGYKYGKNINPVEWLRADSVELGDFVVMPKIEFKDNLTEFVIDPVSVRRANEINEFSVRNIAKSLDISRATIMKFVKNGGLILGEKSKKLSDYLAANGKTIDSLIEDRMVTDTLPIDGKITANADLGAVFGLFISDGWIRSKGHEIGFAQNKSEDEKYIPNLMRKVFGVEMVAMDHATSDLRQYRTSHQGIVQLFKDVFSEYEYTARTKYIPSLLMNSSEEFRRGLLDGLWYGDGSHKGHTSYSTVSERLSQGVFSLLVSLGLPASITKDTRKKDTRPEFNKFDVEGRMEYRVGSARHFDLENLHNGMAAYDGKFIYQRVRKIDTVAAEGKVYDFTVPTTNSYVTESFVVHNSGGGSLLAFCTDITEIDPIPHGLIFERFLNPERDSPPDIDSDFDDVNREKVIDYVRQKYGEETVAMIITFGMIKAKSAIKDIARIYEEPFSVGESLTKAMPPPVSGKEMALYQIYDKDHPRYVEAEAFREAANNLDNKDLITSALGVEGKMRSTGVHAAGVIMSSKPLKDTIPLMMRKADGVMITQFDYPTCEDLGLIKMDFLGIRNLTVIDKAIKAIHRNHGVLLNSFEIYDSVLDTYDEKTYNLLREGKTLGVFQLDSPPIAQLLKSIAPDKFGDLSATIALYRPGPMGMNSHNEYADRKNGRKPVVPIHLELEEPLAEIVSETYGIICYQEQVMAIAQKLAGYTMGEADNLRRAMGKKKKEVLDAEFPQFEEGMKGNGYSDDAIKTIWETLIPFAEYGFNKSHSAGYGLISYITAYLKANYPAEFMAANLSTLTGDKDKTALYLEDCRRMGIKVSPPSVSKSTADYTAVDSENILVGLEAIRGVGHEVSVGISKESEENGPYTSLDDFLNRAPAHALSKGVLEGLALAGALDGYGYSRRTLKDNLPEAAKGFVKAKKKQDQGQFSLFDDVSEDTIVTVELPDLPEYTKKEKLAFERHALGLYVSDHPLSGITKTLDKYSDTKIIDILTGNVKAQQGFGERKTITLAGVVNSVVKKPTKKGDMFAMFSLEDVTGSIPCLMFPKTFARLGNILQNDSIFKLRGNLLQRDSEDDVSFSVDSMEEIEVTDAGLIPYVLNLREEQVTEESMTAFGEILDRHKGDMPVYVNITTGRSIQVIELDSSRNVNNSKLLHREVMMLFGTESVT